MKFAGLGVNQTKVIAGSAYIGSCTLTKELVAALLGKDPVDFVPTAVTELLTAHEAATGMTHTCHRSEEKLVQQKLSTERHTAMFERPKVPARTICCSLAPCHMQVTGSLHPRFRALVLASNLKCFVLL